MGNIRVGVDDLANTLKKELEEWHGVLLSDLEELTEKHGKELQKRVKKDSPKRTGSYRKGWRLKKEINAKGHFTATVYNATDYRLTHLLEHGHAKRTGGRTPDFPHLLQNEENVTNEFTKDVEGLFR